MIRTLSFALITSLLPLQTWAQTNNNLSGDVRVEVVIFQSLALRGWTDEYWPELEWPTYNPDLKQFNATDRYARLLKPNQHTLTREVERMTPAKGYDVLAHFAWQQAALPKPRSKPLFIGSNIQQKRLETSTLSGNIRFYQERFGHIEVDLVLDRQIPQRIRNTFYIHQQIDPEWQPQSWRFQLKESRRIRPGELHYLDHPLFGVLIKFERI